MHATLRPTGTIFIGALIAAFTQTPLKAQDAPRGDFAPPSDRLAIGDDGAVELHVVDMPLATVLRMLSIQGKRNIIATPAVTGSVTADLYDVTFEQALRAVLTANDADFRIADDFIYVYTRAEIEDMQKGTTSMAARVFRLNYISAADVAGVIQPMLSAEGNIAQSTAAKTGLSSGPGNAGGDSLAHRDFIVVHDDPDRLNAIAGVIRQLDVRPQQVLVEATILRARLTDDNALGIDFTLVGGVDLELLGSTSTAIQNISVGSLPTDRFERFNTNLSTDFTGNVPDGGVTLGIIKDQVAVFLRALEQVTDTSVIANPKILALNKQVGNVIVGRRDGYITTTVTETQAIQKVEFLETGTQLTFRPFIGTDGFVRMELHPEDSVGGLTAAQLPFEQTTEVTTNVIVRDGHTILIGGLFREVDSDSRSQIPFFGDLPGIGQLFRSTADSGDREEVIILLTVHIIKNENEYARFSAGLLEDLERTRVALRQTAMWHGRERLAQSHYRSALNAFATGRTKLALWNARMAIHNYPRFLPAIKLQEEIRQAREWDDDATIARSFIARLIQNDRGLDIPVFGRPPVPTPDRPVPSDTNSPNPRRSTTDE